MTNRSLRIIFFGTPEFAAYSLRKLAATEHQIVSVVTAPDKPSGRGLKMTESAVKKVAKELNLPILQPTNLKDPEFQRSLNTLEPDLGIVIAFRMLPEAVWDMPKLGTFNLHASLLPQYRGAAPINHAIIQGETETGITTFFLKHVIDTGDIVLQQRVPIEDSDNAGSLHDKLMVAGADLVIETLNLVTLGDWPEMPQPEGIDLKPAPKLSREFCMLRTDATTKDTLNKIRGLSPYPGAWLPSDFGDLKIYKAQYSNEIGENKGIFIKGKQLLLVCTDGCLEILELQPPGKPRMQTPDFINGLANLR